MFSTFLASVRGGTSSRIGRQDVIRWSFSADLTRLLLVVRHLSAQKRRTGATRVKTEILLSALYVLRSTVYQSGRWLPCTGQSTRMRKDT